MKQIALYILAVAATCIQPAFDKFKHRAFSDNFAKLDLGKWRPEITAGGGGNWEFQFYNNDRRSSFVENGTLYIKPTLTMDYLRMDTTTFLQEGGLDLWGNAPGMQCTANGFYGCQRSTQDGNIVNPIMSAQLRTVNSFNFKYGRVEVVARLPRGDWIWPAIWMMPRHHVYGGWPASGEIDIVESRGNADDCHGDGVSTVSSALHWGNHWSSSKYDLTKGKLKAKGKDFSQKFTKFTLEWTEDHIRTWADTSLIMDFSFKDPFALGNYTSKDFNPWAGGGVNAPFDEDFYLILNVAVGGTNGYFPDETSCKQKKPWLNNSTHASADFFANRSQWLGTWECSDQPHPSAMAIKSVEVFTEKPESGCDPAYQ